MSSLPNEDVLIRTKLLLRDGTGRETPVTNAKQDVEKYLFDNDENMNQVINGNDRTRTYGYTDRGELQAIYFTDGLMEGFKFDGNGNQTRRINGMLQAIGCAHDSEDNSTIKATCAVGHICCT